MQITTAQIEALVGIDVQRVDDKEGFEVLCGDSGKHGLAAEKKLLKAEVASLKRQATDQVARLLTLQGEFAEVRSICSPDLLTYYPQVVCEAYSQHAAAMSLVFCKSNVVAHPCMH